jgi:hypothetical protein
MVRQVKSGGQYGELVREYTYDKLDRLIKVNAIGILAGSQFKNKGQEQAALQHITNAQKLTNLTARAQQLQNAAKLGAQLPENATWAFDANGNIARKTLRIQLAARPKPEPLLMMKLIG